MPITAYPPAIISGANVSARTAERAGTATSATVNKAPTAADAARANRQGPPNRGACAPRSRAAMTAPNTVALVAIHVAQPRLPSQMLLSGVGAPGQTTTPSP